MGRDHGPARRTHRMDPGAVMRLFTTARTLLIATALTLGLPGLAHAGKKGKDKKD